MNVVPRRARGGRGGVVQLRPASGTLLKEERGTLIWREHLADDSDAVVKLYRRGFPVWLRCRLTAFRCWHEFQALTTVEALGMRCTPPLFWAQGRFPGLGWGELLATRWVPGCRSLAEALAADPELCQSLDLAPLFAAVGRLHDAGVHHGTLLARNVLVTGEAGPDGFVFCDMPRFHRFPYGIRGTRMARFDLLFLLNTLRAAATAANLSRWLSAYGMTKAERLQLTAQFSRFRNSPRLRRALGLEFNLRALGARARSVWRLVVVARDRRR